MNYPFDPKFLLAAAVAIPILLFFGFATFWLVGWEPKERRLANVTAAGFSLSCLFTILFAIELVLSGQKHFTAEFGVWFRSGEYSFPLTLFVDRLSLPLLTLTTILAGVIGSFSRQYLHNERGFFRFFLLLQLFAFGAMLVFSAGNFDLLLGGWELVGISSVLLIAFFHERAEPVRNALRVFAFYRIADLGLLLGIFFLHHIAGSTSCIELFRGEWPAQSSQIGLGSATALGLLFLLAASGKSAQIPFCSWLPRAMEGPTPSSAIFYGAISVHMGAYLLLRAQPILAVSPIAAGVTILVGALTAALGTLSHRVATDAKGSLAYASMTQLGIIFVEIGCGFSWLAIFHIVGHAVLRTLQFLRAPSVLNDYHHMHAAAGGQLPDTGKHYDFFVPKPVQIWLYRMGLERGYLDSFIDRFIVNAVLKVSRGLGFTEVRSSMKQETKGTNPAAVARVAGGLDA